MIEKLLEFFLHAKAGAISGVLLIGASGALVSATTQNGVTTITVTQASPTPSASASPSASPRPSASPSPSASPRPSASASPSASPSLSASASASPSASPATAGACVEAKQAVNSAFHKHHKVLSKLRSSDDHGKKAAAAQDSKLTSKQADDLLKAIRKAAVKAIHASCPSAHDDDDDEDEDEDKDEDDDNDEDEDKVKSKKPASGLVLTGTPTAIAQQAAAAMDLVMNAVRTSEPKTESKGKSKKGGRD